MDRPWVGSAEYWSGEEPAHALTDALAAADRRLAAVQSAIGEARQPEQAARAPGQPMPPAPRPAGSADEPSLLRAASERIQALEQELAQRSAASRPTAAPGARAGHGGPLRAEPDLDARLQTLERLLAANPPGRDREDTVIALERARAEADRYREEAERQRARAAAEAMEAERSRALARADAERARADLEAERARSEAAARRLAELSGPVHMPTAPGAVGEKVEASQRWEAEIAGQREEIARLREQAAEAARCLASEQDARESALAAVEAERERSAAELRKVRAAAVERQHALERELEHRAGMESRIMEAAEALTEQLQGVRAQVAQRDAALAELRLALERERARTGPPGGGTGFSGMGSGAPAATTGTRPAPAPLAGAPTPSPPPPAWPAAPSPRATGASTPPPEKGASAAAPTSGGAPTAVAEAAPRLTSEASRPGRARLSRRREAHAPPISTRQGWRRSRPTAVPPPADWLLESLPAWAAQDPVAAGQLLVQLLPAQGLILERAVSYDVRVVEVGCFTVTVAPGRAEVVACARPRRPEDADFLLEASARGLAELMATRRPSLLRRSTQVRVSGPGRHEAPLPALGRHGIGLADLAAAGVALNPALVHQALAWAIEPRWTRGRRFCLAHEVTGEPGERCFVTAADGSRLRVSLSLPGDVDAVMTTAADDFLALMAGLEAQSEVSGDRRVAALMLEWIGRASARARRRA